MTSGKAFGIAAAHSGAGKTILTMGIMAALVERGYKVQPFKIGPDFIDPTLHQMVTGRKSYNLDLRMMGDHCCRELFAEKSGGADVSVIEGVMGLFDGNISSTAATLKTLGIPCVLIVDAKSCAESAVAVVSGFLSYDDTEIAGVIFNRIGSDRHRDLIEHEMKKRFELPVLGYVYRDSEFEIPSRHLGLHMGSEVESKKGNIKKLADKIETYIDFTRLFSVIRQVQGIEQQAEKKTVKSFRPEKKIIAVAKDEAFCFYYHQNLELLEQNGFRLLEFSPIKDKKIPSGSEMIYLGGGYPELYAAELSMNSEIRAEIGEFFRNDGFVYGECGGFMYLCDALVDMSGKTFEMVGIFPFTAVMNKRLRRLGYRKVNICTDCLIGNKSDIVHGHEFHYSEIKERKDDQRIEQLNRLYSLDNNSWEGYSIGSAVGSYIHLHLGQTPGVIEKMHHILQAGTTS